jgi:predicted ATP-dependent Lon-type protease
LTPLEALAERLAREIAVANGLNGYIAEYAVKRFRDQAREQPEAVRLTLRKVRSILAESEALR